MKKIIMSFLLLSTVLSAGAAEFDGSVQEWKKENESFGKPEESFQKAFQLLKEKYADKNITEADLYRGATEGMLAALNSGKEKWNTLLSPKEVQDANINVTGEVVGIGATLEFEKVSERVVVRGVIPDSAAEKAGVQEHDIILGVDGKHFKELPAMVFAIRGKAGEVVHLKILREDKIIDLKVTRAVVRLPLVLTTMIDDHTGYMKISGFTNNSVGEVKKKLDDFSQKKLSKLILDLRTNQGGVFDKAVDIISLFLKKGQTIVMEKSRNGSSKEIKAKDEPWSPQTKLVVLVDEETSSSAEVMAEALKEQRQAVLIGMKTAGKWTVETLERLPNDYYIKYSVMSLQTPGGKSLEGIGIIPDFEIKDPTSGEGVLFKDSVDVIKRHWNEDSQFKAAAEMNL